MCFQTDEMLGSSKAYSHLCKATMNSIAFCITFKDLYCSASVCDVQYMRLTTSAVWLLTLVINMHIRSTTDSLLCYIYAHDIINLKQIYPYKKTCLSVSVNEIWKLLEKLKRTWYIYLPPRISMEYIVSLVTHSQNNSCTKNKQSTHLTKFFIKSHAVIPSSITLSNNVDPRQW